MMISVIKGTPTWVWFVFAYLMFVGIKSTQVHTTSLYRLLILPTILTIMAIKAHNINLCILVGIALGFLWLSKKPISVDKKNQHITFHGSYVTLCLLVGVFGIKYFFGAMHALNETFFHTYGWLEPCATSSMVGIFIGRTARSLSYFFRY